MPEILVLDWLKEAERNEGLHEYYIGPTANECTPANPKLAVFRDILRGEQALSVFSWWLSLFSDAGIPTKSQLNLRDMASFASAVGLAFAPERGKVEIKLAGTKVEAIFGTSLHGCSIDRVLMQSSELCRLAWKAQFEERRLKYYIQDLRHLGMKYKKVGILELPIQDLRGEPWVVFHVEQLR
jgi:hypothetical protein